MYEHGRKVSAADYINLVASDAQHRAHDRAAPRCLRRVGDADDDQARDAQRHLPSRPELYLDELWTWIAFEYPVNATGQPAITLPAGFSKTGLPIGLQIVGRPNGEFDLLSLAASYELARPWKQKRPALFDDQAS